MEVKAIGVAISTFETLPMGEVGWAGEFDLVANVTEVLRAQKDHRTLSGQLIFACPDAGVLDVLRKLRPHEGF